MSQPITPDHAPGIAGEGRSSLKADAVRSLGAAMALVALAALALGAGGGLGTDFSLKAVLLFMVLAGLVWRGLFCISQHASPPRALR